MVAEGSSLSFELTDPNALKWLQQYGADEIKYISDSQCTAIKNIITQGYQNGTTYQQQAREIRECIGLDPRRAETLRKYSDNLFSKGKTEEEVWRLMEKKGMALLNQRAKVIAIQEATVAGARGYYETTADAVRRGILDPYQYEGYRIVTGDERLCAVCGGLAGEARRLPDGTYNSSGSNTPKLHTICRCVEGIREIQMKKREMKESGKVATEVTFEAKSLKRKDGVIYCPTVPLVEGVFSGLGIPVLRLYEEFSKDAKWLQGLTVLTNHEDLSPSSRRIGQLSDPQPRPGTKDVAATTQFYEMDLTQREIEKITSKEPLHGSLSLSYNLEDKSGDWNGKHYEAIERGPYVFYEYSLVRQGIVTPEDGAGFNMECKGCKDHNHQNSHSRSSAPGGADMEIEQVKEMINEAVAPLKEQLATLEAEKESLKGELKTYKEAEAKKQEAADKALFLSKLKPGFLEAADGLWKQNKEVGFLAFEAMHPEMIIKPVQERKLKGAAIVGESQVWSLEQEREKLKAEGKVL